MAQTTTVGNVQKHILRVERFSVHFLHPGGRDVNDNRGGVPRYGSKNAAPDNLTEEKWKSSRFLPNYSNFKVHVLFGNGSPALGHVKLSTVRSSYTA